MNEKLSAFMDDELSELEERHLLLELGRAPQLRAAWGRYHLIRAVLRNELDNMAPAVLPGAVADVVAGEPLQRRWRARAVRTVGGLAIAASVAAVAILNLPSSVAPRGQSASVTSTTGRDQTVPSVTPVATRVPTSADALNAYLVEHSEFAPTAGMGNMLPYVRTVGYDSNR